MLKSNQINVVTVDGNVFLGKLSKDKLENAMSVGGGLTSNRSADMGLYIKTQNVNEALTVNFGTHTAVGSRDLTEEEANTYDTLMVSFKRAEKIAIPKLVNQEFDRLGK